MILKYQEGGGYTPICGKVPFFRFSTMGEMREVWTGLRAREPAESVPFRE
jgi:hypothetical protein